jgi:Lrp/AsnC family transcriptional regulator for asnA, asnC and gidA
MDALDGFIIAALQQDGRAAFTEIAREAGVSETTVRSRYQRLVERGIIRTLGVVEPRSLGFRALALVAISVESGTAEQIAVALAELPEVSYLVTTLGSFDLLAELCCRDLPHLTELIVQRIQPLPGIRDIDTMMIIDSYRWRCRWSPLPVAEGEGAAT